MATKNSFGTGMCFVLLMLFLPEFPARVSAQESLAFGSLPGLVQQAAREILQTDGPFEAEAHMRFGTLVYEVETELEGDETGVTLTPSGNLVELETEIGPAALPPDIRELFDRRYPGQDPTEIERIAIYYYELELPVEGEERIIRIYPTGRIEEPVEP